MKKIMGLLFVLMLVVVITVAGCGKKQEEPPVSPDPPVEDDNTVEVRKVDPVVVVINNHAAARPQSGLQQASIVYELLAEGGITRLLAVFDVPIEENITVGPIRSLRPYFAVQAMEHGGLVANSGYSDRTKEMIRGLGMREVAHRHLWRDNSRKAPHNLYTDIENLYEARGESEIREQKVELTDDRLPGGFEEGREIEVVYSGSNKVNYVYEEDKGYLRSVNGKPHADRETGEQYWAWRVIVRENRHTNVSGTDLIDIDLEGSGSATLYEEGKQFALTWEKTGGVTRYYYDDGSEVDLTVGNTWIQVVR
jgi:predicted small lipoprotein YifL